MQMAQPVILKDYDPAELAEIEEIEKRCYNNPKFPHLHLMPPAVVKVQLEVIQGGKVTAVYRDLSRSWVRNCYNFINGQTMGLPGGILGTAFGAGTLAVTRTSGTVDAILTAPTYINAYLENRHVRAGSGVTANGIVVGTSTAAETFEGYILDALIANGTGAGQMSYAAMDALTATWDGGTKKFTQTLVRYINNNSGGSITVNEAGLYYSLTTSANQAFMLARDLLAAGVAVADTAQLKVTYSIQSPAYP